MNRSWITISALVCCAIGLAGALTAPLGCVPAIPPPSDGNGNDGGTDGNSTDPTNRNARYVGSSACRQCHPAIAQQHSIHGHAHMLTGVQRAAPQFPEEADRAGVPNPPDGFVWADISYLIGGYMRKARFVDQDGYILTNGFNGVDTQWNLSFTANGTQAGFVPYEPEAADATPYAESCFRCHTTGAAAQDPNNPEFQDGRPGFIGTWEEASVQCEACHGPGGNHFTTVGTQVMIDTTAIYINTAAQRCGQCHTRGDDPSVISAADGFIYNNQQWNELLASGGHSGFDCTTCHSPHISANYDRDNAIRNECTDCHTDQNMAIHDDKTLVRGDYVERLTCTSCHMTYATKSAASASADVVGDIGRMGDIRTHIFRIDSAAGDFNRMFSADGSSVRKDSAGRAAVTVDFVCLRCHNGKGNAFMLTVDSASSIANGMHEIQ